MKLVCLNIWGGKEYDALMQFLKEHSKDTDIFCLQEVFKSRTSKITKEGFRTDIFSDITKVLANFEGHFAPMQKGIVSFRPVSFADFGIEFGQAIFVKKSIKVKASGSEIVHAGKAEIADPMIDLTRILQYVQIKENKMPVTILNFHGLASWPKTDTPERIKQSEKIKIMVENLDGRKILCGDFNSHLKRKAWRCSRVA